MELVHSDFVAIDHTTGAVLSGTDLSERLAWELMEQARSIRTAAVATPPSEEDDASP